MYKSFTAADYRKNLGLPDNYAVNGFLVYGNYKSYPYEQTEKSLQRLSYKYTKSKLEHDFLDPIFEFEVNNKRYWFVVVYGSALLSEYLHLACLFGSTKNLLLGSCGGLKKGASSLEIIVPDWSFANESSASAYQPDANNKYASDRQLSGKLTAELTKRYKFEVHRGPTVTHQAMMAESWEDVVTWSQQGYIGVEMEAATVFAVSNHFKVPSAAVLRIGDNLIEKETVISASYEKTRELQRQISQGVFDVALRELLDN